MFYVHFGHVFLFFLFKQKTAYEMRISDWSSDVCSSDLRNLAALGARPQGIAVIGEDAAGAEVEALARACVAPAGGTVDLLRSPARATTLKDRFIAAGQQLLRVEIGRAHV